MDIQEQDSLIRYGNDNQAADVLINARGLTLVELMVTLVVILLVIAGASSAYLKLLGGFKGKISDTQMDTLCGLELLRYDVEMAGYGLPHSMTPSSCTPSQTTAISYTEATSSPANTFNDATTDIPRGFRFSNNGGFNGSDVLVVKSIMANISNTAKKWSMLYKDGANWIVKDWSNSSSGCNNSTLNFTANERIMVVDDNRTLCGTTGNWSYNFSCSYTTNAGNLFTLATGLQSSTANSRVYLVYGVDPDTNLTMPFNRVDYYLATPSTASDFPSRCFPGSYVLYRSTINQSNGARNAQPLIDCVMDFQVAFGLDTDADGGVETWQSDLNLAAGQIRAQLRELRVFVLYQEGRRDDNFRFSGTLNLGDGQIANNPTFQTLSDTVQAGALSTYTPVTPSPLNDPRLDPRRYRWKVAKLAIKPMNLE